VLFRLKIRSRVDQMLLLIQMARLPQSLIQPLWRVVWVRKCLVSTMQVSIVWTVWLLLYI
jgi:hypothetical protein